MMAFVTKNAADILADKQLMGNLMGNAKLQFRGILSQRDCIALAVGNKGATTIQIGQVYTPAAVAVIEGSVSTAAEQGIILKAGKVLAAGYPAGKIGADTAEKICDEVKDGETDAEEIAEEATKDNIENNYSDTLTDAQRSRLNALENTIENNLKESDFSGTLRDLQDNPVPNPQGEYFDHITEMKQSYTSLKKIKRGLEGSLKNPNLSDIDREILQNAVN